MITVTKQAAEQILLSARKSQAGDQPLRIAAKRNNEGGIEYALGFDEQTENDESYQSHNVTVIVSKQSLELLEGTELDFVELDDGQQNFIFKNPNDPNYVPAEDSTEHHF